MKIIVTLATLVIVLASSFLGVIIILVAMKIIDRNRKEIAAIIKRKSPKWNEKRTDCANCAFRYKVDGKTADPFDRSVAEPNMIYCDEFGCYQKSDDYCPFGEPDEEK